MTEEITKDYYQELPKKPISLKRSDLTNGVIAELSSVLRKNKMNGYKFLENTIYSVLGRKLMNVAGTLGWNRTDYEDRFEKDIFTGLIGLIDNSFRKGKKMDKSLQKGVEVAIMSLVARNVLYLMDLEDKIIFSLGE